MNAGTHGASHASAGGTHDRFVLDASVSAAWCLTDEGHRTADRALALLERGQGVVPSLWLFEMLNVLVVAERRGRITAPESAEVLHDLGELPILVEPSPVRGAVLDIARATGTSAYDAAYLELALRLRIPFATLDERLAEAASSSGIELL